MKYMIETSKEQMEYIIERMAAGGCPFKMMHDSCPDALNEGGCSDCWKMHLRLKECD